MDQRRGNCRDAELLQMYIKIICTVKQLLNVSVNPPKCDGIWRDRKIPSFCRWNHACHEALSKTTEKEWEWVTIASVHIDVKESVTLHKLGIPGKGDSEKRQSGSLFISTESKTWKCTSVLVAWKHNWDTWGKRDRELRRSKRYTLNRTIKRSCDGEN